jgi:sensor histidine kinase YesM
MTLLGWIGMTPLVLRLRRVASANAHDIASGPRLVDALRELAIIAALTVTHALVLVALTSAMFIPIVPSWGGMLVAALVICVPLDLLAYLAIVSLAYVSDVERRRRDAARREEALRAETLDSRLTALRARLNPHFLFNALNSVHVLARAGKTDQTIRVVEGLTTLLRYVLDERRPTVPLGDELAFAREYLEVQRVRFGERLQYEIVCPPHLGAASVPQLLLQPLVENAVEHGVASALDGGAVRVTATRDGDMLRLVVEDDGPGSSTSEPSNGIGLSNTRERLARLYGGRATLTFVRERSEAGGGSRVEVDIPFEISPAIA